MESKILSLIISIILVSPSAFADKKTITLDQDIVLRTIEGELNDDPLIKVESLPELPKGTVLRIDDDRHIGPHKYVNHDGSIYESNSGWLYGFLIESLPEGVEPEGQTLEDINKMRLYTLYNNLGLRKQLTGYGAVDDGPVTNLSGDLGKCASAISGRVGASTVKKASEYYNKFKSRIRGNYAMLVNFSKGGGDRAFIVDIRRCRVVDSGPMSHGKNFDIRGRDNPQGRPPRHCSRKNETRPGAYLISGLYRGKSKWYNISGGNKGIRLAGLTPEAKAGAGSGVVAHEAWYGGKGRSNGCLSTPKGLWRKWYGKYMNPKSFIYIHAPFCSKY